MSGAGKVGQDGQTVNVHIDGTVTPSEPHQIIRSATGRDQSTPPQITHRVVCCNMVNVISDSPCPRRFTVAGTWTRFTSTSSLRTVKSVTSEPP